MLKIQTELWHISTEAYLILVQIGGLVVDLERTLWIYPTGISTTYSADTWQLNSSSQVRLDQWPGAVVIRFHPPISTNSGVHM